MFVVVGIVVVLDMFLLSLLFVVVFDVLLLHSREVNQEAAPGGGALHGQPAAGRQAGAGVDLPAAG